MPRLRRRSPRLAAATLAFCVAVAPVPAAAHHYAGHTGSPTAPVTSLLSADPTSDQGRFITLWDARFRSGDAFQAYLDSDQVYDDGYGDRRPEEQRALVEALVWYWHQTDPGFRDHVDWEGVEQDPAAADDPDAEPQRRPTYLQVVTTVEGIIFHKEQFKEALNGGDEGTGTELPRTTPEAPADTAPADPLGELALAALAELTAQAQETFSDATSGIAVGNVLGPVAEQLRNAPRPDLDRLPTSGDIAGVDLGTAGDTVERVATLLPPLDEAPASITVPVALAAAGLGPQNLVYGVCWQLPTTTQQCPGTTYAVGVLTQLPGQAAGIDVDNNVFTGQLGIDLEIGLVIDPLSKPGGLGAAVTVKRYGTAAEKAKGVIRYALPDADTELRVGFDGRTVTLQGQQTANVMVEDLVALSAGDIRLSATVSHNGVPGGPTVALVTETASTVKPHTVGLTTSIVRAPAALTTRAVLRRSGTTGALRIEARHTGTTSGPSAPTVRVQAAARLGSTLIGAGVALHEVPAWSTVDVLSDDGTNTTKVEYRAQSQLARIEAGVQVTPDEGVPGNRYTAALDVHRLPVQMDLQLQHEQVTYNASSAIGSGTGLALTASLEEHTGGTLNRRAFAGLSSVPQTVTITQAAQRYVLNTGTGIARAEAAYYDRAAKLTASLVVTGFPGRVELAMPTADDPRIAWSSSAPTGSVAATVEYGVWRAGFEVTDVPTSMSVTPATNRLEVNTNGTGATLAAYLTNQGTYATSPHAGDNYATAQWHKLARPRLVRGGVITAAIAAAVKVQGIKKVLVTPGDTTTFEVRAGAGAPLYLLVRIEDDNTLLRGYADARLVNFPGTVTGSIGATTTVTSSANTDLTAYAEYGRRATLPALPQEHGLVFRRELVAGGTLSRARLWLTGLPTSVTIGAGQLSLSGLRPTQPNLVVDINVLDDTSAPVTAYASLSGIPTGVPHTVNLNWATAPYFSGYRTTVSAMTSNASFGRLEVRLGYARYGATLVTSALPRSLSATITEAEGQTIFQWSANAPIASISAGLLARATPGAAFSGRGRVELTDIPSSFTLSTGRDSTGSGPLLTYTSNGTAQLDATVVADGTLKTSNASITANLFFRLVNLAPVLNVSKQGAGFSVTGSGRTGLVEARVSARAAYSESNSGTVNSGGWVQFPWAYRMELTPVVKDLSVTLSNIGSLTVVPGISTKVSGDFGSVDLRWNGFIVDVKAEGRLRAVLDLWVCKCQFTVFQAALSAQWGVDPMVRIYEDAWQEVFSTHLDFWCAYLDFKVWVRPRSTATSTFTQGIHLPGTPGATRTYWLTPAPFGWVRLADVVTGVKAFGGSFVKGWHRAEWVCW